MRSVTSLRSRLALVLSMAALACVLSAASATAGQLYVLDFGSFNPPPVEGVVSRLDTKTNAFLGTPFDAPVHPSNVVFSPDAKTAYVLDNNALAGSELLRLDAKSGTPLAVPTPLPTGTLDIAITPDGSRLYVVNFTQENVIAVDPGTGLAIGTPIQVGKGPEEIAITPDGTRAYVTNRDSNNLSVIDLATGKVIDTVAVGKGPLGVAITPDGTRAYVANGASETVSVLDTRTDLAVAGSPISAGNSAEFIAVRPDGREVYVSDFGDDKVTVIDSATNQVITTITVGNEPTGIAFAPDGKAAYVANLGDGTLSVIDATTNARIGKPIEAGFQVTRVATVPDQPPVAAFSVAQRARPGVPVVFDAGSSSDPDGSIGRYAWSFGDGAADPDGGPAPRHVFARPGSYEVSLTLSDDEGCSTAFVFTGGSAICNGSVVATATRSVTVTYPSVAVRCPAKAKAKGCLFKLQAVTKKRKGKAETGVARIRVKAGKSAKIALKPTAKFAATLATARSVLVKKTARIGAGKALTSFARLKIVG